VTIALREPPRQMFPLEPSAAAGAPNTLSFDLGEPGSVEARFLAKEPGATMELGPGRMRFDYSDSFSVAHQLEAYERLIHDAMIGDHTMFTTAAGIERLWEISTPLLADPPPAQPYPTGSRGPDAIHKLVAPYHWYLPDDHPSEES
jgi:glucose-6-phosphate 1-dehydrogenase